MQCGHMLIANAQNAAPELLQQFAAACVALLHSIVDGSIDFDDPIKRGAVEIDDEARTTCCLRNFMPRQRRLRSRFHAVFSAGVGDFRNSRASCLLSCATLAERV